MKLAEIPRVRAGLSVGMAVKDLGELEKERHALGTRAADLLGYHGLVADVTGQSILVRPGKLAATLQTLGIDTLDLGSVLTYQMEEAGRLTREKIEADNLDDWTSGYFTPAQWAHTALAHYTEGVPEFALALAIQIKEAEPDVHFYVQHLNQPKADPFLVASIGKEIYYIAAWDEPGFEGRIRR